MTALAQLETIDDPATYGGKAASLGAALRAGLPVPPGVALSWSVVSGIAHGDAASLAQLDGLLHAIDDDGPAPVAVRSSAVGEDSELASFAGQHITVLHVRTHDALLAAVQRVWASGCAAAALAYRKRMGVVGEPRMGVVVQRLVEAECAGVLFTKHPLTGADERVIEAAWGLGETVVAGLVTPDSYRVARDGRILSRVAGEKDVAVRSLPGGGAGEVPVPEDMVRALCLDDARLGRLADLASLCERLSSGPQDLEWAFAGERLYLLQQRAMTRSA